MSNRYDLISFRRAIEQVGASPTAIAGVIGCAPSTVYAYLRRHPDLRAAYEAARGEEVGSQPQFPKEVFEKAIAESYGVKTAVAGAVGCSRQTVDNALVRWPELADQLDAARGKLVGMAVSALYTDVKNKTSDGHQRAYMFALKTLAKEEFSERQEVTGADGAALLSPEGLKLAELLNMDLPQVGQHFEKMIKAEAKRRGLV